MGAFFTNVQIHCGGAAALDVRAQVAEQLHERVLANGRFRAIEPDEVADRRVVLRARPDDKWVSLYDQVTEDQNVDELDALLRQVSQGQDALGVMMHDSDVLKLHLARGGHVVDRYCSDPTYFGEEAGQPGGNPALWQPLMGEHPPTALQRAFKARAGGAFGLLMWMVRKGRPDAHTVLAQVSRLLGIDLARVELGNRYLGDDLLPDDVVLRFRLKQRPSWERESTAAPGLAAEQFDASDFDLPPVVLERLQRVPVLQWRVGQPMELRVLSWNRGRAFRGVRLLARFDDLPFDSPKVEVWSEHTPPVALAFSREGAEVSAAAPEIAVAGALLNPLAEPGPGQMHAYIEARSRAHVGTVIEVIPQRAGRFEASLRVEPLEGGSAAEHRFVVEIA